MIKDFNYQIDSVIEDTRKNISKWIYSEELKLLLKSFGLEFTNSGNMKEDARKLLEFSEIWDYRNKQKQILSKNNNDLARWLIKNENLSSEQKNILNKVINPLGLIDVYIPKELDYDYILSLGGGRLSPVERTKYVAYLIDKYKLKPKAVVALSCMRKVIDSEREFTDMYAKGAETEFDLMNESAKIAFDLKDNYEEELHIDNNPNKSFAVRKYESNYSFDVISIAGPSSEPNKRRANSADTYRFFIDKCNVGENKKILLVTSQIYVPYQMLEAIRTWGIPTNNKIETIGYYFEKDDLNLSKPENYLQEIRSTIQSINRFLEVY